MSEQRWSGEISDEDGYLPPDVHEQDYRLCIDFSLLQHQINLCSECQDNVEVFTDEDRTPFDGMRRFLEDIQSKRDE